MKSLLNLSVDAIISNKIFVENIPQELVELIAIIKIQKVWRQSLKNELLTVPCFCDFYLNKGCIFTGNDCYGNVCFFHGMNECFSKKSGCNLHGEKTCLCISHDSVLYNGKCVNVHYVGRLSVNSEYSWSCKPITYHDFFNDKLEGFRERSNIIEDSDHISDPTNIKGEQYNLGQPIPVNERGFLYRCYDPLF